MTTFMLGDTPVDIESWAVWGMDATDYPVTRIYDLEDEGFAHEYASAIQAEGGWAHVTPVLATRYITEED